MESAPPEVSEFLRSPSGEPTLFLLNAVISDNESVFGLVYCFDPVTGADGYLALTGERLLYVGEGEIGEPEVIAIAFDQISGGLLPEQPGADRIRTGAHRRHGRFAAWRSLHPRFGAQLDAAANAAIRGRPTRSQVTSETCEATAGRRRR